MPLNLKLITPERLVLEETVDQVTFPAPLGILPL